MTSVVKLCAFANSASVPRVVLVDMQQQYLARPRLLAGCWIEGIEPFRNEMIFERTGPSCYVCEPFAAFMDQSRGGIVMAGFAGESSCLSTLIDAFRCKHKVTYLFDASASHALDDLSADQVHRAVSTISGLCAEVCGTAEWIAATVPFKLRDGKLGNGMSTSG